MAELDPASRPVLVLDFGAQYVQLIARRVREHHAFARIVRHDITADRVRELNPLALILSGGPARISASGFSSRTRSRSEEHTSELQSHSDLVCRLLLVKTTNK